MTLFRASIVPHHKRASLGFPHWLLPLLVAIGCIAVYVHFMPGLSTVPLGDARYWRQGFHSPEKTPDGQLFRWTKGKAELALPADKYVVAKAQATLRLQSGRVESGGLPVHFVHQEGIAVAQADNGFRSYHLLVSKDYTADHVQLQIVAPTFRPKGEDRRFGVAVANARLDILPSPIPWWPLTSVALLAQVILLPVVLRRIIGQPVICLLIAMAVAPLQLPWLLTEGYGRDAAVVVSSVASVLSVIALGPYLLRLGRWGWFGGLRLWNTVPGTPPTIHAVPWTRSDFVVVSGISALALVVRILLIPHITWQLNGDDYLPGVFALNILQGDHALYYGHHHGTIASYLTAPILLVTGPSLVALFVERFVVAVLFVISLYGLGRDLYGRLGGIVAASWMMLPSATAMFWTLKPQPYLETLLCATLVLWGIVRLLWRVPAEREATALMAGIGLMAAIALWTSYVVAPVMVAAGWVVLVARQRLPSLPRLGYAALVLLPVLAWLLPLAIYVVQHPNDNPLWFTLYAPRIKLPLAEASRNFVEIVAPLLLGALRPSGRAPLQDFIKAVLIGSVCLASCVAIYQALAKRSRAVMLPLILALVTIGTFLFTSFNHARTDVRYILPLYVAIPLAFAVCITFVNQARYGIVWSSLGLAVILLSNSISSLGDVQWGSPASARPEAAVAQAAQRSGIRYIHTDYWMGMGIMFESGARITASSLVGPNRTSYDPKYEQRVLAAEGRDTAFLFRSDGPATPVFEAYLMRRGIQCERIPVQRYILYNGCTPFPSIDHLQSILPEAIGP